MLKVTDNTGVLWLKVFQIYGGSTIRTGSYLTFLKGSAKVIKPPRIFYQGIKLKTYKKSHISKAIFVRGVFKKFNSSLFTIKSYKNAIILLKKKKNPKSKYILGFTFLLLKRKKFINLFRKVF